MFLKKKKSIFAYPGRIICTSFAAVILIGTFILMLPICAKNGRPTPFIDALFTATSATCVTGLIVYDTYNHWTVFGQTIILTLIQIGGLGLVTFTSFFSVMIRKRMGMRSMQLAQESINSASILDIQILLKQVVYISFSIEFIGALILSTVFIPKYGADGIFISIFLSVSAFCNAGFDILGRETPYISLCNYNDNIIVILTISLLIIIGGLGFAVWHDIIDYRRTKKMMLHTKVVLIFTVVLIVLGALFFAIFEWNNPETLAELPLFEKFTASFFQSVTTRTAGFNSVNVNSLNDMTMLLCIVLMFIGAAPGSTGGGIKLTTVSVIIMTVISVVRGKSDTIILGRKVDMHTVYKAFAVTILAGIIVLAATGIIILSTPVTVIRSRLDVLFEATSAFATVGLSSGISNIIGEASKLALTATMFLGRVGPVSFIVSLAMNTRKNKQQIIPEGKIFVG